MNPPKFDLQTAIANITTEIDALKERQHQLEISLRLLEAEGERLMPALALLRQYGKAVGAKTTVTRDVDSDAPKTKSGVLALIVNTAPQPIRIEEIGRQAVAMGRPDAANANISQAIGALVASGRIRRVSKGLYWKTDMSKGAKSVARLTGRNGNGNGHDGGSVEAHIRQALAGGPLLSRELFRRVAHLAPKKLDRPKAWLWRNARRVDGLKIKGRSATAMYSLTS